MSKNIKLVISVIILLVIAIGGILAWRFSTSTTSTTTAPMKVAKYYWPGEYWVEIADQKGWFKEAGLTVELVDTNPNYFKSLQDVVDGKLDTQEFVLFDFVKYLGQGAPMVAVLAGDRSFGADGIVAKKDIIGIPGLRGKKIGVSENTYLNFILDQVLIRNSISDAEVAYVYIQAEKSAEEFAKGTLDAVVTYEPYLTQAVEKGNGHKIFDTSQLPGVSVGVYAFRRDFVEHRPDDVQKFVGVWRRTTDYIKTNPDEAFSIIARIYGVSTKEVKDFATLDKILDRRDNTIAFSFASGLESFHGLARNIENFLREKNYWRKILIPRVI